MSAAAYQAQQTEAEFQAAVIDLAQTCGWLVVHIRAMVSNPAGLPDLLLWRQDRYVLAELKSARGTLSARQQQWHAVAAAHGVTVLMWRPDDWDEITRVLSV
jgi:hypothetical protein